MDMRHLHAFVIIAEEMHLTRAAERLQIAQPHVTRMLQHLEEELGFPLFDRSNKRQMTLTPAGQTFLTRITSMLKQYEEAVRVSQRISQGEAGKLVVGYTAAATFTVLPAILQEYQRRGEGEIVPHDLSTMARTPLHRALRDCRLDVAFVLGADDVPGIAHEWVCQAPLRVVLPADHPLARLEAIPLAELSKEPWVWLPRQVYPRLHDEMMALCQQAGFHPRIEHIVPQAQAVVSLVAAYIGISVATQWAEQGLPQQGIVYRPLADVSYQAELQVEWRKDDDSPLVQTFLQVVREVSEQLYHPSEQKGTSE